MKIIGLITNDFRMYYRLVEEMKRRDAPFISLSRNEMIPFNIGVVLTTPHESDEIDFPEKVTVGKDGNISGAVDRAQQILRGRKKILYLVIGIDPGMAPGIAVLGDGELINQYKCYSPQDVSGVIEKVFATYDAEKRRVKIGHQAVSFRNRIVNDLLKLKKEIDFILEIVDETNTTLTKHSPDINAAIEISFMSGAPVERSMEIRPTEGEIRNIQKKSRIASMSQVTISRELAESVAVGELGLQEAIDIQRGKKNDL